MVSNFYFNNYTNSMEQSLLEDLAIESIRMHGIDIYYIPRVHRNYDRLMGEDDVSEFRSAYMVEVYIKNVDNFEGQGDFLSKFGLQIRDSMTLTMAMKRFQTEVGEHIESDRPQEGALIWMPLNNKIFEIMHVEHESVFYQLGQLYVYDLRVELFEYSNELFQTGIPEIDAWTKKFDTRDVNTIKELSKRDPLADNQTIEDEALDILDFSEHNPFGGDVY